MNKQLLNVGIAIMACLLTQKMAALPVWYSPSLIDNYWFTGCNTAGQGAGDIVGINTAMIDFPGDPSLPNKLAPGSLIVLDYFGNGTAGGVEFLDYTSSNTVSRE